MTSRNIRARMAYHGLTSGEVADKIGMAASSFSERLNGKTGWWLEEAVALTNYFRSLGDDIGVQELFEIDLLVNT